MISAVVFCPMAPVLIPDVARGAAPELDELRTACRAAIARATVSFGSDEPDESDAPAEPDVHWHLLGPGKQTRSFGPGARGTLAGLGVPLEVSLGRFEPGQDGLPLSLTVGAWLLNDAVGTDHAATATALGATDPISTDLISTDLIRTDRDTAVLVLGDGSARRGVKAPGYLDDRAAGYDEQIAQALAVGDPEALAALDPGLAADLLASGVPVWRAIATVLAGREWDAQLHHSADPYGVAYFVASWRAGERA